MPKTITTKSTRTNPRYVKALSFEDRAFATKLAQLVLWADARRSPADRRYSHSA
jgi:hypothetical protein